MFKGTSASAGIGIGKAVIVEEAELVITRNEVADAEGEIQRFKGALEKTIAATQKWLTIWLPAWERRKQRSCRDI